jgi:hypothetical protein
LGERFLLLIIFYAFFRFVFFIFVFTSMFADGREWTATLVAIHFPPSASIRGLGSLVKVFWTLVGLFKPVIGAGSDN